MFFFPICRVCSTETIVVLKQENFTELQLIPASSTETIVVLKLDIKIELEDDTEFHRNNSCIETIKELNKKTEFEQFHRNNSCIETIIQAYCKILHLLVPPKQ